MKIQNNKNKNKVYKIFVLHTFGLGDSAMAIDALDTLNKYEKNIDVFCKEKSAIEYFSYFNLNAKSFSLLSFVMTLIIKKIFSKETPVVMRTAGGSPKSNKALKIFLDILNIEYFYDTQENLNNSPCTSLPQRVSTNNKIVQSYLLKQDHIKNINNASVKKHDAKNICFVNYLKSDYEMIPFKKIENVNEIIFHFGNSEKYNKTLNEKKIDFIIRMYRHKYPKSSFSIIYGPREQEMHDCFQNLFDDAITNKKISEFLDESYKYDLCVCNDTGIGHILSQNGINIDLCINSNANILLHKIMCKNTNQIVVI